MNQTIKDLKLAVQRDKTLEELIKHNIVRELSISAASDIYDKATRYAVMRRDKMQCFLCAKKEVQIHEVVPRSHFGKESLELCFSIKNRVCLCQSCHEKAHTIKWRIELLKRMSKMFGYSYPEKQFQPYQG